MWPLPLWLQHTYSTPEGTVDPPNPVLPRAGGQLGVSGLAPPHRPQKINLPLSRECQGSGGSLVDLCKCWGPRGRNSHSPCLKELNIFREPGIHQEPRSLLALMVGLRCRGPSPSPPRPGQPLALCQPPLHCLSFRKILHNGPPSPFYYLSDCELRLGRRAHPSVCPPRLPWKRMKDDRYCEFSAHGPL